MRIRIVRPLLALCITVSAWSANYPAFCAPTADPVIKIASTVIVLTTDKKKLFADLVSQKVEQVERVVEELTSRGGGGYLEIGVIDNYRIEAAYHSTLMDAMHEDQECAFRIFLEDIARRNRIPIGLPNRFLVEPIKLSHKLAEGERKNLETIWSRAGQVEYADSVEARSKAQETELLMKVFAIPIEKEN